MHAHNTYIHTVTHICVHPVDDYIMPQVLNVFSFDNYTKVGSQQCVQFSIVNDSIVEKNETFTVQLNEVASVIFSERDTTVVIQDNDCMLLQ